MSNERPFESFHGKVWGTPDLKQQLQQVNTPEDLLELAAESAIEFLSQVEQTPDLQQNLQKVKNVEDLLRLASKQDYRYTQTSEHQLDKEAIRERISSGNNIFGKVWKKLKGIFT